MKKSNDGMKRSMAIIILLLGIISSIYAREKININMGWTFLRQNVEGAEAPQFDDSKWQRINLPHDAAVVHDFQKKGNGATARVGFLPLGQGWYRRHIAYNKEWDGQRIVIEFEGVYRDAKVYVNGYLCEGKNPNGYLDFEFDITDMLHEGDNVIAVSYDNRDQKSSRWYNGEGINRDVWIHVLNPLHVARYGTYITTPKINEDRAKVAVETNVKNEFKDSVLCRLVTEIYDPQGTKVATKTAVAPFASGETYTFRQEIYVDNPKLWNVGDGQIYKAVSKVERIGSYPTTSNDAAVSTDEYQTNFGIREIEMTPENGLMVNGKRVYINGVCLHTDLGPLGTASFEAAWDRRLEAVVGQMECNGIRLSHNAYPKYVLDWADRHGILVVDEFFDKWDNSYYGVGAKLGSLHLRDMKVQMERDRNHPSVFMWSVGNEVYYQIQKEKTQENGVEKLKMLVNHVRSIDPSRKITCSQYPNRYGSVTKKRNLDKFFKAEPHQFDFYTDVVSTNYTESFWDKDHVKYPQLTFMAGELAVGDLGYDYFNYDHSYPIGHFYWGGTDYIGESFGWPSKGWTRGLIDFTNQIKPLGKSIKSFYTSEPMVEIVTRPRKGQGSLIWNDLKMNWRKLEEHWNYENGDTLEVQVMSNCDETELFLNGKSLGRKQLPPKDKAPELVWTVLYNKGELKAIGYNDGKKVKEDVIRTAGKPAKLIAEPDVKVIKADGMDLAYINYTIVDKDGNVCATDDVKIEFTIKGQGTNAGVANSNMLSDEPWHAGYRTTSNGRCQLIIRSAAEKGKVVVKAKAKGLKTVSSEIEVQ